MGAATIHTTICRISTVGIKKHHKASLKTEKQNRKKISFQGFCL